MESSSSNGRGGGKSRIELAAPASTPSHLLNVQQRQCQAIYANLDAGRPTGALRECQRILGDHLPTSNSDIAAKSDAKKNPLAAALKALALMRLRRDDEAISSALSQASAGLGTADHDVLLPLTAVLDRYGHRTVSADLLDTAAKLQPQDEQLCQKTFETLIVTREYQRAQQLAIRMYKTFSSAAGVPKGKRSWPPEMAKTVKGDPAGHYFWWSVVCYHLMHRDTSSPSAAVSLELAERMILKHTSVEAFFASLSSTSPVEPDMALFSYFDGSTSEVEQFHILLSTLTKQGKWREAFATLQSDAGRIHCGLNPLRDPKDVAPSYDTRTPVQGLVGNPDIKEIRQEVMRRLQLWKDIKEEAMLQVKQHGDRDWATLVRLVDAAFKQESGNGEREIEDGFHPVEETRLFLEEILPTYIAAVSTQLPTTGSSSSVVRQEDKEDASPAPSASSTAGSKNKKKRQAQNKKKAAAMKERALFLARLEIDRQARQAESSAAVLKDAAKHRLPILVHDYFDLFSSKRCAYEDLRPAVLTLSQDERTALTSSGGWVRAATSRSDLPFDDEKELTRYINAQKLRRLLRTYPTADATPEECRQMLEVETASAREYFEDYLRALPLGRDLPKTEMHPADDLAFLAGEALVSAWSLSLSLSATEGDALPPSAHLRHLYDAAELLTQALQHSPKGYVLRLLLIRICVLLGAWPLALEHFLQLGVKSVQQDSLTHWLFERCSAFASVISPNGSDLQATINKFMGIYNENKEDTPQMIFRAFHFHNYSRAEELLEFYECLDGSLMRQLFNTELMLCELSNKDIDGAKRLAATILAQGQGPSTISPVLHDQRDFNVFPSYMPADAPSIWELLGSGPRCNANFVWSIASAVQSPSGLTGETTTNLTSAEARFARRPTDGTSDWDRLLDQSTTPLELLHTAEFAFRASVLSGASGKSPLAEQLEDAKTSRFGSESTLHTPSWLSAALGGEQQWQTVRSRMLKEFRDVSAALRGRLSDRQV
ncbi:hypothetical protein K437DRAFT_272253 [Tilletiaria anomala UBC 951]|uniref:Uncharacterized protein n=1 Tax=Tilletiaria anomala (strain ATCC 24038 / CBS 436.72 / UBC 951) TaxID=1037660 RepID=A0A066WQ38_TILAU|nr:uncharacterized protein K437DRAFT_272253 [Tilletiaria anomala UBC 951]KDN52740.1 hypothetical protein K437DRAFT_272253 [Tilletiaria anomala UBC 951]